MSRDRSEAEAEAGGRRWPASAQPSGFDKLRERARTSRQRSLHIAHQMQDTHERAQAAWQQALATWDRILAQREGRLTPAARNDTLRFSAYARLVARLRTMPVIEQAKGVIMAESACSEDQAFDMLRQGSQRLNVPVRDLAAWMVAAASRRDRPAGEAPSPTPAGPPGEHG